jgi:transcriptional regulator with XRE-family HTH domain
MMQGSLGRRLHRARLEKGLSLRAAAAQIGVTKETLMALEKGHRDPHPTTLGKLARGYGIEIADLLGPMQFEDGTETPKAEAPPLGSAEEERRAPLEIRYAAMPAEEFDEVRKQASLGQIDGAKFLEDVAREYDAIKAVCEVVPESEELSNLRKEARRRWRVVSYDRSDEDIALDEEREPWLNESNDSRLLPLEEADSHARAQEKQF